MRFKLALLGTATSLALAATVATAAPAEARRSIGGIAEETCDVPFDVLGRVLVGSVIGVVLHYLGDRNPDSSHRDLQATTEMLVRLANAHPAPNAVDR